VATSIIGDLGARGAPDVVGGPVAIVTAPTAPLPVGVTGLCVFTVGGERYALHVAFVAEVVAALRTVPVPLAPAALVGLANLRGVPLEVLDAGALLAVPGAPPAAAHGAVVVFSGGGLRVGLLTGRIEAVLGDDRPATALAARGGDHPLVVGILEHAGGRVTVLDGAALAEHIGSLRMRRAEAAP
jgi:purine-binding chemotaxis protein CheW